MPNDAKRGPLASVREYFLGPYAGGDFLVASKARATLYICLVLVAADILPFAVMVFNGFVAIDAAIRLAGAFVIAGAFALLRTKRQSAAAAAAVAATVLFLYAFVSIRPYRHYLELYIYAYMFEFGVLVSCLVGRKRSFPAIVAAISFALVVSAFLWRVLPRGDAAETRGAVEALFFIGLFYAFSGFLGSILLGGVDSFIILAREAVDRNEKRIAELRGVVLSAREGVAVGDALLSFVAENEARFRESDRTLAGLKSGLRELSALMDAAKSGEAEIAALALKTSDETAEHASDLLQTSASVEQINATIEAVTRASEGRRARIAGLRSQIDGGAAQMARSEEAISKIAQSSAAITQIGKIIQKISSQTNLLAMNASIEAAHAGEFGKGFAVVADEIRTLAEQTNANAVQITRTLKDISEEIARAQDVNKKALGGFRSIESEVEAVSEALEALFNALDEISGGVAEIAKSVVGVRESSARIQGAATGIKDRSGAGAGRLESLGAALAGHESAIEVLISALGQVAAGMAGLEKEGRAARDIMVSVNRAIENLGAAGGDFA